MKVCCFGSLLSVENGFVHRYASEPTIVRYAKIAMKMKDKTVRDVALRCRWMTVRLLSLLPLESLFISK